MSVVTSASLRHPITLNGLKKFLLKEVSKYFKDLQVTFEEEKAHDDSYEFVVRYKNKNVGGCWVTLDKNGKEVTTTKYFAGLNEYSIFVSDALTLGLVIKNGGYVCNEQEPHIAYHFNKKKKEWYKRRSISDKKFYAWINGMDDEQNKNK